MHGTLSYIEIANKIFFIPGEKDGRYPFSNSLFIDGESKVLIDTGMGHKLAAELAKEKKIDLVLISHGHEDHTACNYLFKDAKICCHKLDAPAVRSVAKLKEHYGSPPGTELEKSLDSYLRDFFGLKDSRVDLEFENSHVFDLGSIKLNVIHTPGHSAGHCCFSVPSEHLVFLADIDLSTFGPWYGCMDSDVDQFITSIGNIKALDFEVAIPSHKPLTYGHETINKKLDVYLNKIFEREKKLLDFLSKERTVQEIVLQAFIYQEFPEPKGIYEHFEKIMMEKHLERLVRKNLVTRTNRGFKLP